jgi:hypothetical protein
LRRLHRRFLLGGEFQSLFVGVKSVSVSDVEIIADASSLTPP